MSQAGELLPHLREDVHDVGRAARRRGKQQVQHRPRRRRRCLRQRGTPARPAHRPRTEGRRSTPARCAWFPSGSLPGHVRLSHPPLQSTCIVIVPDRVEADGRRGPRHRPQVRPAPPGRRGASAAAPASPPCLPAAPGIEDARPRPAVMKNATDAAMSRSSTPATSHQCSSPGESRPPRSARHEQPVGHGIDEGAEARRPEATRQHAVEQVGDRRRARRMTSRARVRRQQHECHGERNAQRRAEIGNAPLRARLLAPRGRTSFGHLCHPRPPGVP